LVSFSEGAWFADSTGIGVSNNRFCVLPSSGVNCRLIGINSFLLVYHSFNGVTKVQPVSGERVEVGGVGIADDS
jgi:hypothetical protein